MDYFIYLFLDPKEEQSGTTDMTMEVDPESKPKSNKPRKNVTWARESYLEEYFYFELDETERGNYYIAIWKFFVHLDI